MNYQEKLVEEEEALEQQQKVANEIAENELFDGSGLEADADDNYDVVDVTTVVDSAVEASDAAVIAASQGSLGVNTPINEQSIALATSYLTEEVADAQKVVDGLKGPKMTAVNNLQSKLDAYQNAADAVEGVVVNVNKVAVSFAGQNTAEDGKALFAAPTITAANILTADTVSTITLTEAVEGIPAGAVTVTQTVNGTLTITDVNSAPITESTFKKALVGADLYLASLSKLHTSLESVGKAETAVQVAVGGVLGADDYKLIEITAAMVGADNSGGTPDDAVKAAKGQPWSKLPFDNSPVDGLINMTKFYNGDVSTAIAAGDEGKFALVKDGELVDITTSTGIDLEALPLYTAVTGIDETGSVTTTPATAPAVPPASAIAADEIADGLIEIASVASEATAAGNLSTAKGDLTAFNKAVAEWKELAELQEKLEAEAENVEAAAEAVEEAEELFEDLGVELVKADNGVATGSVYDENSEDQLADLFVFQKGLTEVDNFDGNDILYFGQSPDGSAYNLVVLGKNETITGDVGSVNAFDIFAVQDGANTTLYIEEKAFAGNGSTKADLIEVELVGVTAADLVINDGFLTLA